MWQVFQSDQSTVVQLDSRVHALEVLVARAAVGWNRRIRITVVLHRRRIIWIRADDRLAIFNRRYSRLRSSRTKVSDRDNCAGLAFFTCNWIDIVRSGGHCLWRHNCRHIRGAADGWNIFWLVVARQIAQQQFQPTRLPSDDCAADATSVCNGSRTPDRILWPD